MKGPSEAELMKIYALKRGIFEEDIILEVDSRDTQGNAYFTKQIIRSKFWENILVVTSDFHLPKTKFFFDFVYGENYNLQYDLVGTDISKEEREKLAESEKKSQEVMEKIYLEKNIKKGEDKKRGIIVNKFYSRFNKNN